MPTRKTEASADYGLFNPVTANLVEPDDDTLLGCLITAEVALTRAWAELGVAPQDVLRALEESFRWNGPGELCDFGLVPGEFDVVTGGNPVIPLIPLMREHLPEEVAAWVHRGATSQDIMDSALMLLAARTGAQILARLEAATAALHRLAEEHARTVTAARTLTQHGVPTTMGARFAGWERGLTRARTRLTDALAALPAQLGGAGGTLASFVQIADPETAMRLPGVFAEQLGLAAPEAPWHTVRWPVTEFGDALTQAIGALGVIAGDIATLSRTEIAELSDAGAGGSSAMPQKANPTRAVLIRSAAIRAPHLGATLHSAAALAVDERPDGAWHAEWPTLRELLRTALGAATLAEGMLADLRVEVGAVQRNLEATGGLLLAERISAVLGPIVGAERVKALLAASAVNGLTHMLNDDPTVRDSGIDLEELLDPKNYLGLAPYFSRTGDV